jgi:hypothetical protein
LSNTKKIWYEIYGYRSKEFINGVIAGIEMYAHWRNGQRIVGIMEEPLKEVIEEVKQQLGYYREDTEKG